jgi:MFS family permease
MSDTTVPGFKPPVVTATVTDNEDAGRLDGASSARLLAILVALVLFSEIVPLQYAMIGVLIPKIGEAFPASGSSTSWALTIIGVVGAATMALMGKASDLWGKKRVLLAVGVFFLAGTLVCVLTRNWAVFLAGRGLQAVCLGIPAVGYGIIRDIMPRRWIPVAVGLVATGLGVSAVAAPLIGGLLTDHYSWRSVFWFLLIYAIVTAPVLALVVPESPYRVRQRFDWLGSLLIGTGVAGVLVYLSEGTSWGWGSLSNLAYLLGGLVVLALFLVWETRISYPMMEMSLLRAPQVSMVMAISLFATICITVPNYLIPYLMETPSPSSLRGLILTQISAREHLPVKTIEPFIRFQGDINYAAGFSVFQLAWHITLILSVAAMIFGPIGGLLARRYGARLPMVLAAVSLIIAFELWARFHGAWADQATIGVFWGAGFGLFYAAGPNLLIDAVPPQRQGVSSGMFAVSGAIGTALATATLTPILAAHPYYLIATPPGGKPIYTVIPQVYTNVGYSWVYLLVGGIPAMIALILAYRLRSGRDPARGGAGQETILAASAGEATPPYRATTAGHPASSTTPMETRPQAPVPWVVLPDDPPHATTKNP